MKPAANIQCEMCNREYSINVNESGNRDLKCECGHKLIVSDISFIKTFGCLAVIILLGLFGLGSWGYKKLVSEPHLERINQLVAELKHRNSDYSTKSKLMKEKHNIYLEYRDYSFSVYSPDNKNLKLLESKIAETDHIDVGVYELKGFSDKGRKIMTVTLSYDSEEKCYKARKRTNYDDVLMLNSAEYRKTLESKDAAQRVKWAQEDKDRKFWSNIDKFHLMLCGSAVEFEGTSAGLRFNHYIDRITKAMRDKNKKEAIKIAADFKRESIGK